MYEKKDIDAKNRLIWNTLFKKKHLSKTFVHIGGRPITGETPPIVKLSTYADNRDCYYSSRKTDFFMHSSLDR